MAASKINPGAASGGLLAFIGVSAIAGVLVTASVTPAIAVTSLVASNSITVFENLPSYLDVSTVPQKSTIWAQRNDGSYAELASFYDENREAVAWDQVSQFAKDAAIAGEDRRFYEHNGIDLQGTVRAVVSTVVGGDVQGGSTITQQYVKNVLATQGINAAKTQEEKEAAYDAATEQTLDRKLKEMRYAIALEKKAEKNDILLGYLNIAYFGGQVYGIQAAAQYYFGVNATDLTAAQAASLIAMVQNPERFRIDYPEAEVNGAADGYAENKVRRNFILKQMLGEKFLTQAEYEAAIASPVEPKITQPSTGCQTAGNAAYFCDYVTWIIKNDFDDPNTPEENEGDTLLRTGGLNIYTTLDFELQQTAADAMAANVPFTDPRFAVGAAAASVQVGTGRVLAMVQNKNYSQDETVLAQDASFSAVNYSTDFRYGGSSGFQPGSTYKVFTLADWLAEGHSLRESFNGARRPFTAFTDSCKGGRFKLGSPWNPRNDDGSVANNAVDATAYSVNSSFVAMAEQLDLCKIKQTAEAFGVHRADGNELQMNPSDVLGTQEVAPLTMAAAFAGIANDGLYCSPIAIDKIIGPDGEELQAPKTTCRQAVTPEVAVAMQFAMQRVFSGTAAASRTGTGVAYIGKTGTTDGAKDTWMVGASKSVATAVWVGNSVGDANLRQIRFDSGSAATARHRIWPAIMQTADAKYGGADFAEPGQEFFRQVTVDVPNVIGMTPETAKAALEAAGFAVEDGGQADSDLPLGVVAATDPSGSVAKGSTVRIITSNAQLKPVPNVVGKSQTEAQALLTQAGFASRFTSQATTDAAQVGKVLSQNPGAGLARLGSTIDVVLGQEAPKPTPTASGKP